jgi:hypothetical protein
MSPLTYELGSFISQKTTFFVVTTVKTPNVTLAVIFVAYLTALSLPITCAHAACPRYSPIYPDVLS